MEIYSHTEKMQILTQLLNNNKLSFIEFAKKTMLVKLDIRGLQQMIDEKLIEKNGIYYLITKDTESVLFDY